jgi:manganese/zinc-transporting P-type ATPase C
MALAIAQEADTPNDPALRVISDAAGRMRVLVEWVRCNSRRAVAVEEAVAKQNGVRAVHAYPRTGSVVVWYSPRRCDRSAVLAAISGAAHVAAELIPARAPHSSEIRNTDVLRMVIGGAALALLGVRRYVFARPPLLGPSGRVVATGVTIFTGYPFLRGALRSLRSGKAGTDALVSAATVASLILRENVVALTVLWLLNIGEYLQDLTLRRTRRAISELLRGSQDTAWIRLTDGPQAGTEIQVPIDTVEIGDEVVVHDHVAIPVDGEVVDGEAVVDQSAITGETLPVSVMLSARVHAGSVVVRGRVVVRAHAVGNQTTIGRIITRVAALPGTHSDGWRKLFSPFRSHLVHRFGDHPGDHRGRPACDDHAVDRLPVRGGFGHPDRDQRRDRQRRAPRHPHQGWIPPGAGGPG